MRTNFIDAPWFVCVFGGYNREPYKNGRTNRGAIWGVEWCGPKDHALDGCLDLTHGNFGGDMLWHAQTYWQSTCLLLFAADVASGNLYCSLLYSKSCCTLKKHEYTCQRCVFNKFWRRGSWSCGIHVVE